MSKRFLTEEEIEYVLSDLRPIPGLEESVSKNIRARIVGEMRDDLCSIQLYEEKIDELKRRLTCYYYSSQIQPGDAVGIATAQSIGERQTQLALNSFHSTGITTLTVVSGVPRFNELVNATKNPKSVISSIYLSSRPSTIQEIRRQSITLPQVLFKDILKEVCLHNSTERSWYSSFRVLYPNEYKKLKKCDACIRCTFHLDKIYTTRISLREMARRIMELYAGVVCVWSPLHLGCLDIWFHSARLELSEQKPYITEQNRASIFMDEVFLPLLRETHLQGVEGIQQINYVVDGAEWHLEAMGSNLKKLFAMEMVDETRTTSNHMWEIYHVLGVEATREFLLQEFTSVISTESFINSRHIELLVDVMLYTGDIASISRYGVHKNQSGALTKCSFEESLDQILKAGIHGEDEQIRGVSGAIITGKRSHMGSGLCDLLYHV